MRSGPGVIVVTSAGNESLNVDNPTPYGNNIYPGVDDQSAHNGLGMDLSNIIVTAAVDSSNKLSSVSCYGPTTVDLGAPVIPGSDDVTSYSTGYTTGVAGVVAALTPGKTPAQRIAIITGTVTNAPQSVGAWSTSGGVINPAAAVRQALGTGGSAYIAAGSSSNVANSPFVADTGYFSGNTTADTVGNSINLSGVANPAPAAVYQNERYSSGGGSFTYTIPNLVAGAQYDVRLDFSENYANAAGVRQFNVKINGNQVLTNFDIFAAAGGQFKAVAKSFEDVAADGNGKITIEFDSLANLNNAKIDGIEIAPAPVRPILIASGSTNPVAPFAADEYANGGSTFSVGSNQTIDTAGIDDPPPQSVLQNERDGNFTYTVPNLTPGAGYIVRLIFSENYYQGQGQRLFNVAINNVTDLYRFDIYQMTHTRFKAVAESFFEKADPSSGQIKVVFTDITGGAKVDAVEVTPVAADPPRAAQVDLSGSFNVVGITVDGSSSAGNLDGAGRSYSANLLGGSVNLGTASFSLGQPGANDAIRSTGQVIPLPAAGASSAIRLLGTAVGGEKSDPFVINYTDGTSTTGYLNFDDWYSNRNDTGGAPATQAYLNTQTGKDTDVGTFFLYQNTISINPSKTVSGLTLPNDPYVVILAADLLP